MKKPKLGQKITASDRLRRAMTTGCEKKWIRFGDWAAFKPQPVSGVYVGSRTKQNGHTEHHPEYAEWVKTGQVNVWLIVESDRTNPICVLPEDCSSLNDENAMLDKESRS